MLTRARNAAAALARRPMLAAVLLYAVTSVAMVSPGLIPGRTLSASDYLWSAQPWVAQRPADVRPNGGSNYELADQVSAFGPFSRTTRDAFPGPVLWNPSIAAGRPLLADMQSAQLSPLTLPSDVLPYWWSLGLIGALKLFVAALGTFVLARALAIGLGGSLLAGLAFGLSFYMVTWLGWPLATVWAYLPWLLAAVDRAIRRPDATGVALLAVAGGLSIVAGHPESTLHVMLAAVVFGAVRLTRADGRLLARVGCVGLGFAAAGGLAAAVILPFLELVHQSNDLAIRAATVPAHVPRELAWALPFPEYFGRPTQAVTSFFINQRALYDGALPLLLALVALLRPSRERLLFVAVAVVSLGIVFGIWPLYQFAVHMPVLNRTAIGRFGILFCLAIALLAGWGFDDVLNWRRRAPSPRRDRLLVGLLGAAVVVPVIALAIHAHVGTSVLGNAVGVALALRSDVGLSHLESLLPAASAIAWLLFAGLGAVLVVLTARGRLGRTTAVVLVLGLVTIDLLRFGIGENPAIRVADAQPPATAAIKLLQTRTPARFVGVSSTSQIPPLPADAAMDFGLQDARGYDYPVVGRYDRLWRDAVAVRAPFVPPTTTADTTPVALRVLSLLGVRSILTPPQTSLVRPSLRIAYRGPDGRVYDNRAALPRAWVVDHQQVVAGENAQRRAVERASFAPAGTVVVGAPIDGVAAGVPRVAPTAARRAPIVRYRPTEVDVRATAARRSVVVLSDVFYPGWHATVDGHDAPIRRVDYLLRGVAVGPGSHIVRFTYRPASYRIGWIISILTALALAGAVVLQRRAQRRRAT